MKDPKENLKALGIHYRPIRPEDESFLYRVYASTRQEELSLVDWTDEAKAQFLWMQFHAQHQFYQEQYRGDEFLIILQQGQPIGRLYVGRWPKEIRLIDIALLPEYRNQGIGALIIRDLQNEAAASGRPLRIHVEKFNPAMRLYHRLGFVMIEDKGVYDFMEWTASRSDLSAEKGL